MALRQEELMREYIKKELSKTNLSNELSNEEKKLLVKPPLQEEDEESESSYYYDEEDESEEQSTKNLKKEQVKLVPQKSIETKQIQIQNPNIQSSTQKQTQDFTANQQEEESEQESYYDEEEENEEEIQEQPKPKPPTAMLSTVSLLADELDIAGISMTENTRDNTSKPKINLIAKFTEEHLERIDNWQQDKNENISVKKLLIAQNEVKGQNNKANPFFDIRRDSGPQSGEQSPQFKKKSNLNSQFKVSNDISQMSQSFGVKKQDPQQNVKFILNQSKNSNKSSNLDSSFKSQQKDKTQSNQNEILNQSLNSVKNIQKKDENNEQGDELNITITEVDKGIQKTIITNEESAEEDQLNQEVYNKASGLVNNALVTFQSAFPYDKDNRAKQLKKILKAKTQKLQLDEQVNDTKPEQDSQELLKAINVKQTTFRESLESKSSKNSNKLGQFSKLIKEQNEKEAKIQEEFEKFKQRVSQEKAELFKDRPMVDARFQINQILQNRTSSASGSCEPEDQNKTYGVRVTDHFLQMEETPRSIKEKLIMSLNGSKLSLNGSSQKQELDPQRNRTLVDKQLKERYFEDYDHSKFNDAFNSISISENIGQNRVDKQKNSNVSKAISDASQQQNTSQASEKFEQFRRQIEADLLRISKNSKNTPSRTEVRTHTQHDKKSSHSLSVKSCRVSKKSNQSMQSDGEKIVLNNSFDEKQKIQTQEEKISQKEEIVLNQKNLSNKEGNILENQEQKDEVFEEEDFLFGQLEHDNINLNNQQTNSQSDNQEQTQEKILTQSEQQSSSNHQEQDEQQPIKQPSFCEQIHTNEQETNQEEEEEFEYEQEEDNLEQSQETPEQFSFQNEEIYKDRFTEDNINQFKIMEETKTTQGIQINQSQDDEQEFEFQNEQQDHDSQNLGLQDEEQDDDEYRREEHFEPLEAQEQQNSDEQIFNDELNQDFDYDEEMQEEIEIQENLQVENNITQYTENYENADEKVDYQEDHQIDEYDNLIEQQDQELLIQEYQKDSETMDTYQIENQIIDISQNYQQNTQQSMHAQDLNYQLSEYIEQQDQQIEIVNDWQLHQNQNIKQEQYNPEIADSQNRESNTYTEVPSSNSSPRQEVNFHQLLENEKKDDEDEQVIIDQPYREMVQKQLRTQKQFLKKTPIINPRPQTSQGNKLKGQNFLSRNASAHSYNSLKRNQFTHKTMNLEFNNNAYQMIKSNQTIAMPLRRNVSEKEEQIFHHKVARLSIPVRQYIRAASSSTESRNKKLRSLEKIKSGIKSTKGFLYRQKSELQLNNQVYEAPKNPRTMSGLKIIKGRNKKIQTEEIKAFKIKISRPQTSLNRIQPQKILAASESQPQIRVSSPTRMRNYFDYKTMSDTISNEERAKKIMYDIETLYQIQNAGATFKVQRNNKRDLLALKSGYHQITVKKQGAQIQFSNNQTMNISQGKAEYLPEESLNNYVEVTWRDVQNSKSPPSKASKDQSSQGMQGLQQAQITNGRMNKSSLARIKPHIFESEKNPSSILAHQSAEQFLKKYQQSQLKQFKLEINSKSQANLPKFLIKGQTPIKRELIQPENGDNELSFCNLVLSRTKLYSRLDPRIIQSPFLSKQR